jgi:hypothetical protein
MINISIPLTVATAELSWELEFASQQQHLTFNLLSEQWCVSCFISVYLASRRPSFHYKFMSKQLIEPWCDLIKRKSQNNLIRLLPSNCHPGKAKRRLVKQSTTLWTREWLHAPKKPTNSSNSDKNHPAHTLTIWGLHYLQPHLHSHFP